MSDEKPWLPPSERPSGGQSLPSELGLYRTESVEPQPAARAAAPRLGFRSRHPLIATVLALLLVATITAGSALASYGFRINKALDGLTRSRLMPTNTNRAPAPTSTADGKPMTVVLIGSDAGRVDVPGGRSDSILIAYLPADRKHLYIISFPRDLYVEIPGYGKEKINAAFSYGEAALTVETLEQLLGVRMQHAGVINMAGFIQLTDALGGVTVNNKVDSWSSGGVYHWPEGKINIKGEEALDFVRQRYGLPNGDIDRAERQRAVIKAIVSKSISGGILADPGKFSELLDQVSKIVRVDSELTTNVITSTAMGLRITSEEDIRLIGAPISGFADKGRSGSVDLLDERRLKELREALLSDRMEEYYLAHKDDPPVGPAQNTPTDAGDESPSAQQTDR